MTIIAGMSKQLIDLSGQQCGRLLVIKLAYKRARIPKGGNIIYWNCLCSCGREVIINGDRLRLGRTQSCGCYRTELLKNKTGTKHHGYRHGKSRSRIAAAWQHMKQRCYNKNDQFYHRYGARGISVCERWMIFDNFYADMGDPPPGMTLERIDNNGNYEPNNCKWANMKEQNLNTSRNRLLTLNGETLPLSQWTKRLGVSKTTIHYRLAAGWDLEKALTTKALD